MAPSIYSIRLDDVIIDCPEQGRKQFILFFYCVLSVVCVRLCQALCPLTLGQG